MFLRHDGLLHEIIEYRMRGKPTEMRRRIQMLHDLANDGGYTRRLRFSSDADIVRLTNARIIIIIIIIILHSNGS